MPGETLLDASADALKLSATKGPVSAALLLQVTGSA
jgi:hypothetical protein